MIVGPGSLEPRQDVWLGVSLLGPNVRYPDHRHRPEETYLVISPGDFRQRRRECVPVAEGETFHNPHNVVHAMASSDRPLLAFCLGSVTGAVSTQHMRRGSLRPLSWMI
jgi:hypothetical protein